MAPSAFSSVGVVARSVPLSSQVGRDDLSIPRGGHLKFLSAVLSLPRASRAALWRAVCTKNNVDVVKLILGRVARGRGLVGVTYVGVAYTKWIVVVLQNKQRYYIR